MRVFANFVSIMKKIVFYCLAIAGLLLAASCKDIIPEDQAKKNLLDIVTDDYNAIIAKYPEAKDHLVEARFTLSDNIADVPADQIKAESLTTICYFFDMEKGCSQIFVNEHDLTTGESQVINYISDSPWTGDKMITEETLKTLAVSLEEALASAKKEAGSGDGLDTKYVTLRWPLWPVWENPQYVVGGSASRSEHVFVDAKTGMVSIEAGTVPEGSAWGFLINDTSEIADMYDGQQKLGFQMDVKWSLAEVRYELDAALNAEQVSDLEPVKATYVYYVAANDEHAAYNIVVTRNSFKIGTDLEYFDEVATTPWTGGDYLDVMNMEDYVDLTEAIFAVKLGNVTDTDTKYVTLCHLKGTDNHYYIFKGDKVPSVSVDAFTGELVQ